MNEILDSLASEYLEMKKHLLNTLIAFAQIEPSLYDFQKVNEASQYLQGIDEDFKKLCRRNLTAVMSRQMSEYFVCPDK